MKISKKALYQVKLILNYLPKEEYKQIPKKIIDYVEKNYEYDKNININPNIPLNEQDIDEKAYDMLEKIIERVDKEKLKNNGSKEKNDVLLKRIEELKKENAKIPQIKSIIKQKDEEISELKENNEILYKALLKIPKFIRKFFIKEQEQLLLGRGKD